MIRGFIEKGKIDKNTEKRIIEQIKKHSIYTRYREGRRKEEF